MSNQRKASRDRSRAEPEPVAAEADPADGWWPVRTFPSPVTGAEFSTVGCIVRYVHFIPDGVADGQRQNRGFFYRLNALTKVQYARRRSGRELTRNRLTRL